ncbi:unnamed protein product, partial [Hapterophycus canaliculatus]
AGDGAEDDSDGSDDDDNENEEEDEEDEEEDEEDEEDESGSSDESEEDSGEGSEGEDAGIGDVDGSDERGDFSDRKGHGDFEYDGSFGDMANLMSGLVINDAALPPPPPTGSGGRTGETAPPSAGVTPAEQQRQEQVKNQLLRGPGGGASTTSRSSKGAARSNVTREKLLASMVQEDRKTSREAPRGTGGVPSAAIHAASTVGGGPVGGATARGYQRPDPPGAGKGNEKVRLEVCGENKKTGAPDLNGKKMLVFDRKEPIQNVLNTCRGKLKIKKKAKGAALLEGDKVVDWLSDLSWVPNGAVVLISCSGEGGSEPTGPSPSSQAKLAAVAQGGRTADSNPGGGEPGESAASAAASTSGAGAAG